MFFYLIISIFAIHSGLHIFSINSLTNASISLNPDQHAFLIFPLERTTLIETVFDSSDSSEIVSFSLQSDSRYIHLSDSANFSAHSQENISFECWIISKDYCSQSFLAPPNQYLSIFVRSLELSHFCLFFQSVYFKSVEFNESVFEAIDSQDQHFSQSNLIQPFYIRNSKSILAVEFLLSVKFDSPVQNGDCLIELFSSIDEKGFYPPNYDSSLVSKADCKPIYSSTSIFLIVVCSFLGIALIIFCIFCLIRNQKEVKVNDFDVLLNH